MFRLKSNFVNVKVLRKAEKSVNSQVRAISLTLTKRCNVMTQSFASSWPIRLFASRELKGSYKPISYDFKTINEMLESANKTFGDNKLFGTRVGSGADLKFEWMTYKEFYDNVSRVRTILSHHNVGSNDKVAIISNNRWEWAAIKYAATGLGAQLVPMYEAQMEKDWKYIINDSDAKVIIAASDAIYNQTKTYIGTVGKVESVLCLDSDPRYLHSFKRWMDLVKNETPIPTTLTSEDHIAVIIYTSGTTGNPKGVELSHKNICSNLRGLKALWKDRLLSQTSLAFLPWAHVFGQTTELHSFIATGSAMGIVPTRELILECIPLIKPSMICSVPVLFNRVYDGIKKKVAEGSPLTKMLFETALRTARERNKRLEFGMSVPIFLELRHRIFDKIVFSKIRERLGGNLSFFASGGAATSVTVLEFFEDIGIPVCEGYGLTETSPVITASCPGWESRRLGTCGIPLEGNDVRIVNVETKEDMLAGVEGEVCVSGDCVMTGYRNNPKANDEVFFYKDGKKFFRTGDLGKMVEGKFLKITGRIKEQYKLENGKYVCPAPLEDGITRSTFVCQSFLFGDNKPFNIAIVVPEFGELRQWVKKRGMPDFPDNESLMKNHEVLKLMTDEITMACSLMKSYERPSKWSHSVNLFSQENQLLTPKMSLRRNNVIKAFKEQIDGMYAGKIGVELKYKAGKFSE